MKVVFHIVLWAAVVQAVSAQETMEEAEASGGGLYSGAVAEEAYSQWLLTNREGENALMYVPEGKSALNWVGPDSVHSVEELAGIDMQQAFWSSTEDKVNELYDQLIQTAHQRMCDTAARPETLTVRVAAGANVFVHGSAELEATFTHQSLCGESQP